MKNKTLFSLAISCMMAQYCFGQTYRLQIKSGSFWGYANLKGEIVIPAKYGICSIFSKDGLASVVDKITNNVYFIDSNGNKLAVNFSYKVKHPVGYNPDVFIDGRVAVFTDNKWGFLNTKGELAIAAKYKEVEPFTGGYAIAEGKDGFVILDTLGTELPAQIPGLTSVRKFNERLAPIEKKKYVDFFWGFMNTKGQEQVEAVYKGVGYFNGGLAWARNKDGMVGFIDTTGKWVIQPEYDVVHNFDPVSRLARVKKDKKWGYLKMDGSMMYIDSIDSYTDFSEGLALVKKDGKWGYINQNGNWQISPRFSDGRDFYNGMAAVEEEGRWGVINMQGEWVMKPLFKAIKDVAIISKSQ